MHRHVLTKVIVARDKSLGEDSLTETSESVSKCSPNPLS